MTLAGVPARLVFRRCCLLRKHIVMMTQRYLGCNLFNAGIEKVGSDSEERLLNFLSRKVGEAVLVRKTVIEEMQFRSTFHSEISSPGARIFRVTKFLAGDAKFLANCDSVLSEMLPLRRGAKFLSCNCSAPPK